jgi:Immunity protein 39
MAQQYQQLGLGGVSLTKIRLNRQSGPVMVEVGDELESIMINTNYLDSAPFKRVGLILYFGLKNADIPGYQRINKKYSELPVTIELDAQELRHASREELKRIYTLATLKALIHVGEKYGLPTEAFVRLYQSESAA